MAKADYIGCEVCGGKALYDGNWEIRDQEHLAVSALCEECAKTHVLKAEKKQEESVKDAG